MATHPSILAWRIPMDGGTWRATVHEVTESDMTEQLSNSIYIYTYIYKEKKRNMCCLAYLLLCN